MPAAAQIAINAVPGSNDNVPLNVVVALSNVDNTGVTTWEWTLLTQPTEGVGPAAVLSSTSAAAPTFTPNREGSYLIQLVVNKGLVDEASSVVVAAVRELETGNRIPAIMETTEDSALTGWAGTAINDILRRVTRLTDGGTFVCIADVGLSPGDVVHMSGMATIASGLPGERKIPTVQKALATALSNVDGPLGVMIGNRDGQTLAVSTGEYCRVMVIGALATYSLDLGGVVGDPVYVSDTGTLSLLPGTYIRQVGDVAAVIVDGTYDLSIAAAASSVPRGNASGDLSGFFPDPTVAKINNTTISTAGGGLATGTVLRATGAAAADWGAVNLASGVAVSGILPIAHGGLGNNTVPNSGELPYGNGSGYALLANTAGEAGKFLKSAGAAAPSWSTPTFSDISGTLAANRGGTGYASYTTGDILYASGSATLSKLSAGTTDQILRGGSTPSWGTVPQNAFAANTVPYNAIRGASAANIITGTTTVTSLSYVNVVDVTISSYAGVVHYAVLPRTSGTDFFNRMVVASNNTDASLWVRYVVTGPGGFNETMAYRYQFSISGAVNEVLGSITYPTMFFIAPSDGDYTITISMKVGVGVVGAQTYYISDYRLVAWQG